MSPAVFPWGKLVSVHQSAEALTDFNFDVYFRSPCGTKIFVYASNSCCCIIFLLYCCTSIHWDSTLTLSWLSSSAAHSPLRGSGNEESIMSWKMWDLRIKKFCWLLKCTRRISDVQVALTYGPAALQDEAPVVSGRAVDMVWRSFNTVYLFTHQQANNCENIYKHSSNFKIIQQTT